MDPTLHLRPSEQVVLTLAQHVINLFLEKKYEECLSAIDKKLASVDSEAVQVQIKILQAVCWTNLGIKHEESEKLLNELIRGNPDNSFAYYGLGLNLYSRGEFDKCLEPFATAVSLNPLNMQRAVDYKESAMKISKVLQDAISLYSSGNFCKALEILSLAPLIDPENKSITAIVQNISDNFLQCLVSRLEKDVLADNDYNSILNRVEFLINAEKFEIADKLIPVEELLDSRGFLLQGIIKYMLGSIKLSKKYFQKALELDENNKKAENYIKNVEMFVKLVEGSQELIKTNKTIEATNMLDEALKIDPENKRLVQAIYFQRSFAKFKLGNHREAFEDYLNFETLQNVTGMIMNGIKF